ncbi:MAG: 7-cyano-7-deazaguanine synthase [Nanoarchaeota archaeon]|nr:7-cyano-7-deazaguanine synthase [Nanoarchaeota archaeon]
MEKDIKTKSGLLTSSNKEEVPWILSEVNSILKKRRGSATRTYGRHAIILMSGGMDSSVLAGLLIDKTDFILHPLFIRRGSRAQKWEERGHDYFYKFYSEKYPNRFNHGKKITVEVPPLELKKYRNREQLKKYGHPMRNVVLQSLGVQYAANLSSELNIDIRTVFTATVPDDSFPHSSLLALRTTTLLACIESGDWQWNVSSPLLDNTVLGQPYNKAELIKYAINKKIPLERTRTCIEKGEDPCLRCPECLSRVKAFETAGVPYV